MEILLTRPLKLIECPRDAMQGLSSFVPTEVKIYYLNLLLQVRFNTLDFGSFVSPKAVPQMADTEQVLSRLDFSTTRTKLLAIVANRRGVEAACSHPTIHYLGFPLSVSETFQHRNTHASIAQGLDLVKEALEFCSKSQKELVVYLSMAFGNPYGDDYSTQLVADYAGLLQQMGCRIVSLADTVGLASEDEVKALGEIIFMGFPDVEIGMHLHTRPEKAQDKLKAAIASGCTRIDTALNGLGGCPFAEDELVGNVPTEAIVTYAKVNKMDLGLDLSILSEARKYLLTRIIRSIFL